MLNNIKSLESVESLVEQYCKQKFSSPTRFDELIKRYRKPIAAIVHRTFEEMIQRSM